MSERARHVDGEDGPLRAYLLGALAEEDREALEARFFEDDEQFTRLLDVQYDLIDAYAGDELSPEERVLVEQRLLASPEGRRREQLARALHRFGGRSVQLATTRQSYARTLHRAWPAAAAIAASVAGLVWLGVDNARLRRQLTSVDTPPAAVAPAPPAPIAPSSPEAVIADVTLSPRVLRTDQSLQVVQPPAPAHIVRLILPIDEPAMAFTVGLERAGAGRVLTQASVVPTQDGMVMLWVPRDALPPGDYEALVWRGQEAPADLVGVYQFRVTSTP